MSSEDILEELDLDIQKADYLSIEVINLGLRAIKLMIYIEAFSEEGSEEIISRINEKMLNIVRSVVKERIHILKIYKNIHYNKEIFKKMSTDDLNEILKDIKKTIEHLQKVLSDVDEIYNYIYELADKLNIQDYIGEEITD